jgi:general secretion pathway protein M
MSRLATIGLTRAQSLATLAYAAVVVAFFMTALGTALDIMERYKSLEETANTLARLERRAQPAPSRAGLPVKIPPGSPFLEGQSVTVAGAALVQRMTSAISRAGGSVVSSEVESQRQAKDGYVTVAVTCELEQVALQQVLYEFEAGMPFLTVDELVAQVPQTEGGRLRVRLAASGLWPRDK